MYYTKDELIDNINKALCLKHPQRDMLELRLFAVENRGGQIVFVPDKFLVDKDNHPLPKTANYKVVEHIGNLYLSRRMDSDESIFVPVAEPEMMEKYGLGWAVEDAEQIADAMEKRIGFIAKESF